jgi:hypothetical protein
MIVVVLAVVWAVALTPMVLRKISEHQFSAGARSYHQLLRFGAGDRSAVSAERTTGSVPGATIGFAAAAQRLQVERFGVPTPSHGVDEPERARSATAVSTKPSPATAARRRHVVSVLMGATLLFFLVGILPAARILWDLALFGLGCTAAYIALLIYFRRVAVEQAQKVIALETRRHASEVLESRRQVIAVGAARRSFGGYAPSAYAAASARYARRPAPLMSGSGWSVPAVQSYSQAGRQGFRS